jgi:short-subunit dehydrogenase
MTPSAASAAIAPPDRPRTVIITGGSSGIGRCTADLFARRGWRVGLIARGMPGLLHAADSVRRHGAKVAVACADVTEPVALAQAAETLASALGAPDIWINCAGNGVYGRFAAVPEAQFDRVTAVTYGGTVNGCRVALALMRPRHRGTIVNVCSAIAFHGMPLMTSYAGAKAAVRGFGQALRAELRMEGSRIRLSTVFPPAVNTPFFSHAISHMGWPARPAHPVYQPEVVAEAIYLAALTGPAEACITGTAALFALASRLVPGLVALAMTRLGFDGQLTQDSDAVALQNPTLFEPSDTASGVHGPFGRYARGVSMHLWMSRHVGKARKMFFFEKKNQKTFVRSGAPGGWRVGPAVKAQE